jgi:TetR/AcrR family transcriptional regulator, mexJK operon transcriptional repressor
MVETQTIIEARKVPRGKTRRRELASVAERVFLDRGFANATMQMIATQAGASKETLYRHFVSKESLLAEIVRTRSAQFLGPDGELPHGSPTHVLTTLGTSAIEAMFTPDCIALLRIVVAETPHAPALGAIFYEQGPARVLDRLTHYLRSAHTRNQLRCPHPKQAAQLFLGAVVAPFHLLRLVTPTPKPLSRPLARKHVRAAVEMFLAKYGSRRDA